MKAVFLAGAEEDLRDLRRYLLKRFGQPAWQESYQKIKESVRIIQDYPQRGVIPDELLDLNLNHYRQVISGMNRVIYEIKGDVVHIHVVCDTRRDTKALLSRRLLRVAKQ